MNFLISKKKMIDTIVLTISKEKFRTLDNTQGLYPSWGLQSRTFNYDKYVKNRKNDPRFPRLTFYKRKDDRTPYIKVEFSAGKILFNDNLNEPEEKQAPLLIETLKERLLEMGEVITKSDLENGDVQAFHPSKNIPLSDGYTANGIRNELSKININKKFDLTGMIFKNDGRSLQIHTESHSIVFYDKIADLNQKKKKAVDKDQTPKQFSLFEEIKKNQPKLEVLRMEIRLSKKQKMNSIMQKLGFQKNPKFKDIFKKDVCQKVVKWYWDNIIKGENLFLFGLLNNPKRLFNDILRKNENPKLKESIYLVGLDVLCKDGGGIRELRDISEKYIKQRNWYRYSDDIKLLNNIESKNTLHSWVKQIDDAVKDFKPIKESDVIP